MHWISPVTLCRDKQSFYWAEHKNHCLWGKIHQKELSEHRQNIILRKGSYVNILIVTLLIWTLKEIIFLHNDSLILIGLNITLRKVYNIILPSIVVEKDNMTTQLGTALQRHSEAEENLGLLVSRLCQTAVKWKTGANISGKALKAYRFYPEWPIFQHSHQSRSGGDAISHPLCGQSVTQESLQ